MLYFVLTQVLAASTERKKIILNSSYTYRSCLINWPDSVPTSDQLARQLGITSFLSVVSFLLWSYLALLYLLQVRSVQ